MPAESQIRSDDRVQISCMISVHEFYARHVASSPANLGAPLHQCSAAIRLEVYRRPMASTSSIKDEAMKALESSLASTVELSKSLETKLSASESELAVARAESAKLAREALELRAALAERDEQLSQLKAKAAESEAEAEQSRRRLMALRQAGQEVVGKLGTAVLSAQEASAKPRPLEEILAPLATGAQPGAPHARYLDLSSATLAPTPLHRWAGEERKTEEQLRANFEAVFDACASRLLQC
jgi:hypothetical protein